MQRTYRALMFVALSLALAAGLVGCLPTVVTVTGDDDGTIQPARVGDRVVVRLNGNPSTGFTWTRVHVTEAAFAASPIEPIEEGQWEFPAGGNVPGEPGVCIFEYEVVRTGTETLVYNYARAWEEEPARTFSVTVWARE